MTTVVSMISGFSLGAGDLEAGERLGGETGRHLR